MYIAPSNDQSLLTLNLPVNVILRKLWGCFSISGVGMMHFSKDLWKSIQIHQYYTMALKTLFNIVEDQFDFFFFYFYICVL